MSEKFIGKKVKVEYVQEMGWKKPTKIKLDKQLFQVKKVILRWEEHTMASYWRDRKHRVWYQVLLDDGNTYEL